MKQPLEGVKVVDLSRVLAGPYCTMILGDLGGVMSFTGPADGEPTKVGVAIADVTAGLYAVIGILAALRAREHTVVGDRVDISLLDCQVSWLANVASNYLISGQLPKRYGNQHPNIVPYQVFHAKDIDLVVAVGNDRQFERFCQLIGKLEWAEDPAYSTNKARLAHRDELVAKTQEVLLTKDADHWLEGLMAEGLPCGPISTLDRTFSDPQVLAREMVIEMAHPTAKSVKLVGSPLKLTNRPVQYRLHPPLVGEHTQEVLAEHGYTEEEIRRLQEEGAI